MALDPKTLKGQGFLPQKQKGLYTARVKVAAGDLTTAQLKAIAEAADSYGDGRVHLTSRQQIEIPNVKLEDLESLRAVFQKGGAQSVLLGPKVRPVSACKGSDICRWGCVQTRDLAVELTDRYYGRPLPSKFKIALTGCRNNCLKVEENDLGVKGGMLVEWSKTACELCGECAKACRYGAIKMADGSLERRPSECLGCGRCVLTCPTGAWQGRPVYNLLFGGNFGNGAETGLQLVPPIEGRERLIKALDAALDFFAAHGQPGQRFRAVADLAGWDKLAQAVAKAAA